MTAQFHEDALRRLRTEYLVTSDLLLTPGEAAAMLELDRTAAATLLQALEASGFLELTPDGRFGRATHRRRGVTSVPLTTRQAV